MKYKIVYIFLLLFSFTIQQAVAQQAPIIDSLKIIPTYPSDSDEIQLVCYTTFSNGNCELNEYFINIIGNQIFIKLDFSIGAATYICHSIDTLTFGPLENGEYELFVDVTINSSEEIADSDTLEFSVGNLLETTDFSTNYEVVISPNPFKNEFQIKSGSMAKASTIEIYNSLGIRVLNKRIDSEEKINTIDLKKGIYFLVLIDENGNRYTKKLIKGD